MDKLFSLLIKILIFCFLPLVHMYHAITEDAFLNVAAEDASGLEWIGNQFLIPYQFVFAGRKATPLEEGKWLFESRFAIDGAFWPKMALSVGALPASFAIGGTFKALSLFSPEVRKRYSSLAHSRHPYSLHPMKNYYESLGISLGDPRRLKPFAPLGLLRRPGDENHLEKEKEALKEVGLLLDRAGIPWWLDCGSCLGAYRYGGVIPWDEDIDIAILLPDFDNALCTLSQLNPKKYIVQDWSSRERPKSFIKVFLRDQNSWIDIYHFAIDEKKREVTYVFSLENHIFFPEWWKIRERRFAVPTPFEEIFPLRRGTLDGIDVFLPHNPERYLQRRYGENLAPVKIYNEKTGEYEKNLRHPYWQRSYVH